MNIVIKTILKSLGNIKTAISCYFITHIAKYINTETDILLLTKYHYQGKLNSLKILKYK